MKRVTDHEMHWSRRRLLQAGVAAGGAALLPIGNVLSQTRGPDLVRAPKQALVIGNSSYNRAPLKNPGNDARGMEEALKAAGFQVAIGLDLGQAAMREMNVIILDACRDNPFGGGVQLEQRGLSQLDAPPGTLLAPGDQYTYRHIDFFTRLEFTANRTQRVTAVGNNEVIFNNNIVTDLLGNLITSQKERVLSTTRQFFVSEYSIGKKWETRYEGTGVTGEKLSYDYKFQVVAKERKTIAAGTFDAFKVVGVGHASSGSQLNWTYWIAPDRVRRPLAVDRLNRNSFGRPYFTECDELVSYKESR